MASAMKTCAILTNDEDDDQPVYNETTFTVGADSSEVGVLNEAIESFEQSSPGKQSLGSVGGYQMMSLASRAPNSPVKYATIVNNVSFAYGRGKKAVKALNDITLKVPVGNIYGLLGPSGCGKSTLVHCLVGSLKPRSGFVKVFGEVPGSYRSLVPGPGVGYMPQEIGLFEEFSIEETLHFFGRLYRLPRETIRARIAFLIAFLDLPDKSSLVAKLSGGQKRRVSLAAALVHNPPLLVLDEPTVGIDPVLRQSIWRHLRLLAEKEGITVIITTHYIEEARCANIVAFMRYGRLLEEDHPEELIRRFKLTNLEEVFLALCSRSDTAKNTQLVVVEETESALLLINKDEDEVTIDGEQELVKVITDSLQESTVSTSAGGGDVVTFRGVEKASTSSGGETSVAATHPPVFKNDSATTSHRLMMKRNKLLDHFARSSALLNKNFIRMWRNLPVLIFTALIPGVQCALFFLCLGRNPYDIPVSVYNAEIKGDAVDFLMMLDPFTIHQEPVASYQEGWDSVKAGKSKALISIGANFTKALIERMVDFSEVDDATIDMGMINVHLDMSSQFHANVIREKIFKAFEAFAQSMLNENGKNPRLALAPIHIAPPILGREDPTVTDFMAPGFILALAFFASIATAALTLVLERKDGLLERSMVAGVYPNEYIISHVITQTVVVILQTFTVLFISFFCFNIPNIGPIFWISVLIVMQGVCGMAYGVLVSAIAKEENFTLVVCMGSMFPQFLLSGVVWPVETMPKVLVFISTFFSQATSLDAVRYMLYRGWDPWHHWDVSLGFIVSASWTIVFLFIATILFNVNKS